MIRIIGSLTNSAMYGVVLAGLSQMAQISHTE